MPRRLSCILSEHRRAGKTTVLSSVSAEGSSDRSVRSESKAVLSAMVVVSGCVLNVRAGGCSEHESAVSFASLHKPPVLDISWEERSDSVGESRSRSLSGAGIALLFQVSRNMAGDVSANDVKADDVDGEERDDVDSDAATPLCRSRTLWERLRRDRKTGRSSGSDEDSPDRSVKSESMAVRSASSPALMDGDSGVVLDIRAGTCSRHVLSCISTSFSS